MRRAFVAVAIVTALVLATLGGGAHLARRNAWGAIDSTQIFLRTAEDRAAFRAVLTDGSAALGLLSLLKSMDLTRIVRKAPDALRDVPCENGVENSPRITFTFTFGDRDGRNSRAFLVDYSACKKSEGKYAVQLERQKFGSDYNRPSSPVAVGELGFRALLQVSGQAEFNEALDVALAHWPVADIRVQRIDAGATLDRIQFQIEARAWKSEDNSKEPERCATAFVWYDSLTDTLVAD